MQSDQLEEQKQSNSNLDDKPVQSLKISPYQHYLELNEQYSKEPSIDLLHKLCWYLAIAAQDTPEAKQALGAFSSEVSRRCDTVTTSYYLVNDMLVIDLLPFLGKYIRTQDADAATERMHSRVASIRKTSDLVFEFGVYSGLFIVRHMASPTMREIGSELENTPYYKKIETDLNDEIVSVRINYHHFMNSTPEEKTETVSRLLTEFLLPTGIIRGTEMGINKYRFGTTDYPSLFYPKDNEGVLSDPPVMKHFKENDIRATKGKPEFSYVIMPNGELRITPEKIDKTIEQNRDIKYESTSRIELAKQNPVLSAGQIYTKNGRIKTVDADAPDYMPSGDHLEKLTEWVFRKNGFNEIPGRFKPNSERENFEITPLSPSEIEGAKWRMKAMFGVETDSDSLINLFKEQKGREKEIVPAEEEEHVNIVKDNIGPNNWMIYFPGLNDIFSDSKHEDSEQKDSKPAEAKPSYIDRFVDLIHHPMALYVSSITNSLSDLFVGQFQRAGLDCKPSPSLSHSQSRYNIYAEHNNSSLFVSPAQKSGTGLNQSDYEKYWCAFSS